MLPHLQLSPHLQSTHEHPGYAQLLEPAQSALLAVQQEHPHLQLPVLQVQFVHPNFFEYLPMKYKRAVAPIQTTTPRI